MEVGKRNKSKKKKQTNKLTVVSAKTSAILSILTISAEAPNLWKPSITNPENITKYLLNVERINLPKNDF